MAIFSPTSAFTSVDLPTFGRPATATKPDFISELERLGQELGRSQGHDHAAVAEAHAVEPELVQPLTTAAARRRVDRDRLEVAGSVPLRDRGADPVLLGTDPER